MMAGIQGRRTPGRPGINGIRLDEHFTVTPEELEFIKSFATKTGINVSKEITRKEGYYPELADGEAEFGIYRFKAGEKTKRHLTPNKADMARLEKAIYEASMQADYIMVSIHSHQITGELKEQVPDFLEEICHAAIDMGANAVIGHGPHLLRPVEVYKDSPIFYCLGDFVLELYSIEFAPEDFYEKQGLTSSDTVHDLLKKRSANFTRGLMEEARMMQTVIPYWETNGGKLTKLEFLPVELVKDGNKSEEGLPRIARDRAFMDYFAKISAPYGVEMEYDEKSGVYTCKW
jgi:poly-gamma-glutamate synthesis protein (capsule biosynthesis protein)